MAKRHIAEFWDLRSVDTDAATRGPLYAFRSRRQLDFHPPSRAMAGKTNPPSKFRGMEH